VRYSPGEQYHLHTDWFTSSSQASAEVGGNRASSFFVYVTADEVIGGGTSFPMLDAPSEENEEWCRWVNCDEEWEKGVTFRAVPGNAVFWENLDEKGKGLESVVHAGLPVEKGVKMGMNIWTRESGLDSRYRGDD
jgi:prolyl 4-hydroxylase